MDSAALDNILQFHHIPVERVTASVAQRMMEMTFWLVHRMVDGEEVGEIGLYWLLVLQTELAA